MASNLKGLIGKLNDTARTGLEAAAGFCLSRTHYDIEIEHFLMKLLEVTDSDLQHILKHFAVNKSHFASDLTSSLDKLKTGNARTPVFSPSLVQVLSEAWTTGSLDFGAAQVRSGFCILAIAASPDLARLMREVTREFQKISEETLRKNFWNIVAGSPEDHETAQAAEVPGMAPAGAPGAPGGGKTQNLNQFTIDLTANARAGKVDPVLGRDHEIRQIIDILTRRRQNNPILTGEAGVGKTAVVEGFALRVASCAPSRRPLGRSTRSILRRTQPLRAVFRWSRWRNRRNNSAWSCSAASSVPSKSITMYGSLTRRCNRLPNFLIATSRAGNCPTRP